MTDPVKQKIIELAFPKGCKHSGTCLDSRSGMHCREWEENECNKKVTFADVLRAMPAEASVSVNNEGQFSIFLDEGNGEKSGTWEGTTVTWNLTTDYDGQTQEVKDFIGKLLGV